MNKLYLYFPQWQGSGKTNEIYAGAKLLKDELTNTVQFIEIEQPENEDLDTEKNVIGYQRIRKNLEHTKEILQQVNPDSIFTLGGDCGVEVVPVTFLNERYKSDLLVLWFDAHGDLNTPASSPSKTFHGMPLRMILGEGEGTLIQNCFSILKPEQIVLVGTRDLDQPESQYVQKNNISLIKPKDVGIKVLADLIKKKGKRNIYIHLDLDIINPLDVPDVKCPTAGGVYLDTMQEVISHLKQNFTVVGGSIVEYTSSRKTPDERVVNLLRVLFA